ncbi:hypothetical protein EBZ37_08665 [bacterium]|nr:hypothetical protein [bacterium]
MRLEREAVGVLDFLKPKVTQDLVTEQAIDQAIQEWFREWTKNARGRREEPYSARSRRCYRVCYWRANRDSIWQDSATAIQNATKSDSSAVTVLSLAKEFDRRV